MRVKTSKGITLTTIIVYIVIMLIIIAFISRITSNFYSRTKNMEQVTTDISELNVFNTYFTKEVKLPGNKINRFDNINKAYIIFNSGNIFTFKDDKIFYNTLQICSNVKNVSFEYSNDIITVTIEFGTFLNEKIMYYKVEEIY